MVFTVTELQDESLPEDDVTNPRIPVDLTNFDIRMQMRPSPLSTTILLDLSTANGRIVKTDAAGGEFTVNIQPVDSENVINYQEEFVGVYDIEIEDAVNNTILKGNATIEFDVTK